MDSRAPSPPPFPPFLPLTLWTMAFSPHIVLSHFELVDDRVDEVEDVGESLTSDAAGLVNDECNVILAGAT